jgi:enamine deaminase RidA (YjgF/YER057c/UK114 family)
MERRPINPWSWSIGLGFDQAQLIQGHQRVLVCSGQDAVDADGNPQHPGDMVAQLELALDHLEAVVAGADMTLANIVRLNVYTTDLDELFKHFPRIAFRFGTVALRRACSASRNYQDTSSSCWRQPRLADRSHPSPDLRKGGPDPAVLRAPDATGGCRPAGLRQPVVPKPSPPHATWACS